MTCKTFTAALFLVLVPIVALAQTAPTPPSFNRAEIREKFKAACSADVQKYCAQIDHAKGAAVRECLKVHENDLSAECHAVRDERAVRAADDRAEMREKFKSACSADIQKYCAQIDAVRECLKAHENDLSAGCRAVREERAAVKAAEKVKAQR